MPKWKKKLEIFGISTKQDPLPAKLRCARPTMFKFSDMKAHIHITATKGMGGILDGTIRLD